MKSMNGQEKLPLVSIVIPVYNGADYLREAIDSALGQTYPNCEVIVVNDGSTDGGLTEGAALSYGGRIRYFAKENGRVSTALNLGIQKMRGEYFAWLSHDDIFYPEKIEKQMKILQESGCRMAAASCDFFWNSGRRVPFRLTEFYGREFLEEGVFPVIQGMIQFGGVLLHKSIFEEYGTFREDLYTVQDYEFLFRVLRKEICVFMGEIVNGVRCHPGQVGNTSVHMERERDWMYKMFLEELGEEEQAKAYGSPYSFYYQVLLRLMPLPYTPQSFPLCVERLREHKGEGSNVRNEEQAYIYGAGIYGRQLLFDLRCRGIKVQGFLDKDTALKGREIDGAVCHTLDEINELPAGRIMIASAYREEMAQALQEMGIDNYIYKEEYERKYRTMQTPPPMEEVGRWIDTYAEKGWKK